MDIILTIIRDDNSCIYEYNLYMNIILTIIRNGNSCMTARDINGITNIIHFR